jgi:DNA-binding NarL/FixJ family response regulator
MKKKTDAIVLVAEDHPFMAESIKSVCMLVGCKECHVVESIKALMQRMHDSQQFTHLVLDLTLTDGNVLDNDVFSAIRKKMPEIPILIMSSECSEPVKDFLLRYYNIEHFISKRESIGNSTKELIRFLGTVKTQMKSAVVANSENPFDMLSDQQREIARYLILDWSAREIAETLEIEAANVRVQKARLFSKLDIGDEKGLRQLAWVFHFPKRQ